jgi:Flp pilus assembly protein TadD
MTARRSNRIALTLSAAFLCGALAASAQSWAGRGRVQGEITDASTGKPVEGATVVLRKSDSPESGPKDILTNAKGKWSAGGLAGGTWIVQINKEGYVPSEGSVQVNEFGPAPPIRVKLNPITEEMRRAAEPQANPAVAAIEAGNAFLTAGDYAGARLEYEKALTTLDEQNKTNVRRGIARAYLLEKNTDAALAIVNELLAFNPTDVDSLKIKAQSQYTAGKNEEGITTLKSILAITPADPDMLNLISSLLVEVGREEEARQYMAQMPAGAKVDPVSLLNIGIRHYNEGKMEEAAKAFEEVVVQSPELPEAYYYRGLAYLASGKMKEAKADFEKLLALDPKHAKAEDARVFLKEM